MSLSPRLRLGLVACGPALLSVAATAGTIVVRQDGGGSTTTIQAAIDLAGPGDQVLVHPGTYNEAIDLSGKAIHVRSLAGAAVTVIDATGLGASVVTCTSFEGSSTILDGFTITGGTGTPSQTTPVDIYGGGLYARFSSPTILRCVFSGNSADLGGGMLTFQAPRTSVIDCTFDGNTARLGGGLFNNGSDVWLSHPVFTNNVAQITGGGFHTTQGSAQVDEGSFSGNQAGFDGGGMYNALNSSSVTETDFTGNTAGFDGGGMYNWASTSLVDECEFHGNSAGRGGGMINFSAQPVLTNSLFEGNTANEGAAVFSWSSSAVMSNLTLSGNRASVTGGGLQLSGGTDVMRNCLLWGNVAPQGEELYVEPGASLQVTASDLRGSGGSAGWQPGFGTDGGGNLDLDPAFAAAASGDYRLSPGSACIDAGSSPLVPPVVTLDLDRNPRFFDDPATANTGIGATPVDMGCFEYGSLAPWRDLGLGLAGARGWPILTGSGPLTPGSPLTLDVANAAPAAPAVLVIGSTRSGVGVLGGTLVPSPDLVLFGLVTDGSGRLSFPAVWPTSSTSGTSAYAQVWVVDPHGPSGFAATNGLSATSP